MNTCDLNYCFRFFTKVDKLLNHGDHYLFLWHYINFKSWKIRTLIVFLKLEYKFGCFRIFSFLPILSQLLSSTVCNIVTFDFFITKRWEKDMYVGNGTGFKHRKILWQPAISSLVVQPSVLRHYTCIKTLVQLWEILNMERLKSIINKFTRMTSWFLKTWLWDT